MNDDYYVHYMIRAECAEVISDLIFQFGEVHNEVLQEQTSAFNDAIIYQLSAYEDESRWEDIEQLNLNEVLARSLWLEDDFDKVLATSLQFEDDEFDARRIETRPPSRQVPSESRSRSANDIDPEKMTYEEMVSLEDALGVERHGVSDNLVSQLPTSKYKAEREECVICSSAYEHGEDVTTLPCAHQYHLECLNNWLKLKKNCPVCRKEVPED